MNPSTVWTDDLSALAGSLDASARSRCLHYFDTDRASELAILVCAHSVVHLHTDPRVETCLRVRLAWVRDEATKQDRNGALGDVECLLYLDPNMVTRSVARAAACYAGTPVTWAADYASRALAPSDEPAALAEAAALRARLTRALKHLFPDMADPNWKAALGRFEEAVRIARG